MDNQQTVQDKVDPQALPVPEILPILPLHGFVFFPGMGFPLQVSSDSSKQLIDDALVGDRMIGLLSNQKEKMSKNESVVAEDLFEIGVVGYIHKLTKIDEGYYQVLVSGIKKIKIAEFTEREPYFKAKVLEIPMEQEEDKKIDALVLNIRASLKNLFN